MTGASEFEAAMRSDVEVWCQTHLPHARLVHELNVGGARADIAAVEPDRLVLFEIKSERDTLARLKAQHDVFSNVAHQTIIVAARKWFDESPYLDGRPRLAWAHVGDNVWCYPPPEAHFIGYQWEMPRFQRFPPHPWYLLDLLWHSELLAELSRLGLLSPSSRATRNAMMRVLFDTLSGKDVVISVCRQLRQRRFHRAGAALQTSVVLE